MPHRLDRSVVGCYLRRRGKLPGSALDGRVEEYLIRRGDGLVILFTPLLTRASSILVHKRIRTRVRENGGQYIPCGDLDVDCVCECWAMGNARANSSLLTLNHASTRAGLHKYKVEPYVAVGDVYAVPPHTGRGGWTWYTGSASWMYRAGLESILGFKLRGERLLVDPCVPRWWRGFEITYRRGRTIYHIKVENPLAIHRGIASVDSTARCKPR